MSSAVLTKSVKNPAFSSGALMARQQLTAHDLKTVVNHLAAMPGDVNGATRRSMQQHRFPAMTAGAPLLVDEGLRLPVSLGTALQTAILYQGLKWDVPSNRRYIAAEFFRQYSEILLNESLKLLLTRQIGLDVTASNLVVTVLRGEPTGVQLRQVAGIADTALPTSGNFEIIPDSAAFYSRFVSGLLENNLRPVIAKLVEVCNVRAGVLWDIAIETVVAALDKFAASAEYDLARAGLLSEELNPGERLITPACGTTPVDAVSSLARGQMIYLKSNCCEKFKRGKRCGNCPGSRRQF